jgi:hypothetical protein
VHGLTLHNCHRRAYGERVPVDSSPLRKLAAAARCLALVCRSLAMSSEQLFDLRRSCAQTWRTLEGAPHDDSVRSRRSRLASGEHFSEREPEASTLGLRRALWVDDDLIEDEFLASKVERRRALLLENADVVVPENRDNVKATLELANAIAKAETERETNLNTRGAAVAAVAGLILPIATAVAPSVFVTRSDWAEATRNVTEYLFLAALVFIASSMVMAVVGVLRPRRGGRTKNAVAEAVVNVWRQQDGDVALAAGAARRIEVFWLDRLLRAIPAWHYRNRSKARWLRRAWMFLMFGIILIGSAGVVLLAELRLSAGTVDATAVEPEITLGEILGVIAIALVMIWLLLVLDLVGAQRRPFGRAAQEEREDAEEEAKKIARLLLVPSSQAAADQSRAVLAWGRLRLCRALIAWAPDKSRQNGK